MATLRETIEWLERFVATLDDDPEVWTARVYRPDLEEDLGYERGEMPDRVWAIAEECLERDGNGENWKDNLTSALDAEGIEYPAY